MKDGAQVTFNRHVQGNDIPGPCRYPGAMVRSLRATAPEFDGAAAVLEPKVGLLKLNADAARETCVRLNVRGIPALFLLHKGRVLGLNAGAMDAARSCAGPTTTFRAEGIESCRSIEPSCSWPA